MKSAVRSMNESPTIAESARRGWRAARTNALPGAILVLIAIGVLMGYHHWPRFHEALEVVRGWKERYGFLFSAVSTAFFAGFLPLFFRLIPKATRKDVGWRHLPFFLAFWATKGLEVDLLYRVQARVFGDSADPAVVIPKVIVDQFVYVPLWAVPTMILGYLWKDSGYSFSVMRARLGRRWYRNRCLPLLISNLAIWIPAVAVIYNLPLALQLPLQNLILCLFVLLVMILTKDEE